MHCHHAVSTTVSQGLLVNVGQIRGRRARGGHVRPVLDVLRDRVDPVLVIDTILQHMQRDHPNVPTLQLIWV